MGFRIFVGLDNYKYSHTTSNLILLLIVLFVASCKNEPDNNSCPNPPCDQSLLEEVNFYTIDDLNFEFFDSKGENAQFYNKVYDSEIFLNSFYAPWQKIVKYNSDDMAKIWNQYFTISNGIGANSPCLLGSYREYSERYIELIEQNIPNRNSDFLSNSIKAITTETVDLRALPTSEFCFKSIRNAGEGYPFDYLQESSLWIGTPILVLEKSNDNHWYFVKSPYGLGWVQSEGVAYVNQHQEREIIKSPKVAVAEDNLLLRGNYKTYTLFTGTILSVDIKNQNIPMPQRSKQGQLEYDQVNWNPNRIHRFPLEFNKQNVKSVLSNMLEGKYSWGGLDGGRDCSSTLKDYFGVFGIWLPRNSKEQRFSGETIDLQAMDKKDKLNTIVKEGLPFLSTLFMPGHIVLYLGEHQNETPQIYHSVWGLKPYFTHSDLSDLAQAREQFGLFGLRPRDQGQVETRAIIGKTVITDIEPEAKIQAMEDIWVVPFLEYMETLTFIPEK